MKLVHFPTSLDNLKTRVDDLDAVKLKNAHIDLKRLIAVVDKKVVKNTKISKINTKINKLEKNVPDASNQ